MTTRVPLSSPMVMLPRSTQHGGLAQLADNSSPIVPQLKQDLLGVLPQLGGGSRRHRRLATGLPSGARGSRKVEPSFATTSGRWPEWPPPVHARAPRPA